MNISKLALIALLGGALMAFGCSDDSSGTGGTGNMGGDGGGGMGGDTGTGGAAGMGGAPSAPGTYAFECETSGLPIPLPVTIVISTADAEPALAEEQESTLTTQLSYVVAPEIIGLLPTLAPDAVISALTCDLGVANGGDLSVISHTADGLPSAPAAEFDSDVVQSVITPGAGAGTVDLSVETFETLITGLPEDLPPAEES